MGQVKMTFSAAPPAGAATPVPTLGEWGGILLGGLLAMLGVSRARRSRR